MANEIKALTPKEIVAELDKYIIGQDDAKKKVAIALRSRYRRSRLSDEMREEVTPKNILMMGPTGVGKTEIARRLAKIMDAPFVKVEATKFTEVGYVGRDVDSMVRDLVDASVRLTKQKKIDEKYDYAKQLAEQKVVEAIIPWGTTKSSKKMNPFDALLQNAGYTSQKEEYEAKKEKEEEEKLKADENDIQMAREQVKRDLSEGKLEEEIIEIEVEEEIKPQKLDIGGEGIGISLGSIFGETPKKKKKKKTKVKDARRILTEQEAQNLLDMDQVIDEALKNAEENGIIFIDEIDKIASGNRVVGGEVSREGVQRDILPIVEGSVVNTQHGPVKTDHMLFIGAGAFHTSKPSDLIPELQGRFPINVELANLDTEAFRKILTVPENAVIKQQKALLETDGAKIEFTEDAIDEIAKMAYLMNQETENIGARRLHTILEKLVEEISFNLPCEEFAEVTIDREYVKDKFRETIKQADVEKYII